MNYVILDRVQIQSSNAMSAWMLTTGPSPLAWAGLMRKTAMDLGIKDNHKIKISIIHHDMDMNGDFFYGKFFPNQHNTTTLSVEKNGKSNDYVGKTTSIGMQPVAKCHLTCSIIIEGFEDVDLDILKEKLMTSRLAGGLIKRIRSIVKTDFDNVLNYINTGYLVKERSDLLENISSKDKIRTFIEKISRIDSKEWIVPFTLGYHLISEKSMKRSSRQSLEHAYAEPLIGLIEYISIHKLKEDDFEQSFWGYRSENNTYFIKQS